jgi:hypothetical protein
VAGSAPNLYDFNGGSLTSTIINQWITAIRYAMNTNPQGVVGWGERTTNSSTTSTETGVLRVDNISCVSGRWYQIFTSALPLASTVANDSVRAAIRYAIGATATTSSTQLDFVQLQQPNTSIPPAISLVSTPFLTAGTLSVLLSVSRQSGTGLVQILAGATFPVDLFVVDMGVAPSNTGVAL